MLAVISIMTILVLLLAPIVYRAVMLARLASCAANMRGIYVALSVYAGDNKNFIPAAGAYVRGGAVSHGTGHSWIGGAKTFFFGSLAKDHAFDNPGLLICPGTFGWGGSDIRTSGLYAADGSNQLRAMSDWYDHPEQNGNGNVWSNYGLRWSGWWHKVYPNGRLMMSEILGCFEEPRFNEEEVHGGKMYGQAYDIGMSVYSVGEVNINIAGSDGRIIRLMNYCDPVNWDKVSVQNGMMVVGSDGQSHLLSVYYPTNDRSGDGFCTGWWDHANPVYPDDPPYPHCLSDGPWAFWTNFDRKYFNGAVWPWGDNFWWPDNWQNP